MTPEDDTRGEEPDIRTARTEEPEGHGGEGRPVTAGGSPTATTRGEAAGAALTPRVRPCRRGTGRPRTARAALGGAPSTPTSTAEEAR